MRAWMPIKAKYDMTADEGKHVEQRKSLRGWPRFGRMQHDLPNGISQVAPRKELAR